MCKCQDTYVLRTINFLGCTVRFWAIRGKQQGFIYYTIYSGLRRGCDTALWSAIRKAILLIRNKFPKKEGEFYIL